MCSVDIVDSEQERRLPSPQGILPLMIVTEKGECLSEYMKRKHPDYVTSMQVIVQIAEKLRTMHYAGWAHRDLKPGNTIWLPSRNTWSLIDFGCAGRIGVHLSNPYVPCNAFTALSLAHRSLQR